MQRVITLALGVVVALAAFSFASAQQEPPHRFYGTDATPGDTIGIHESDLTLLGSATVGADGSWYVDVDRDAAAGAVISLNGEVAEADRNSTGAGQTEVSNISVPPPPAPDPCPDDAMSSDGDDSMMEEDSMEEDSMESDDDSMMSEDGDAMLDCPEEGDDMMDDGDDSMMGDDDAMLDEDTAYPATGTGGLADSGGVSAGLLGLLIALAIATVGGLGYRRVRNRA